MGPRFLLIARRSQTQGDSRVEECGRLRLLQCWTDPRTMTCNWMCGRTTASWVRSRAASPVVVPIGYVAKGATQCSAVRFTLLVFSRSQHRRAALGGVGCCCFFGHHVRQQGSMVVQRRDSRETRAAFGSLLGYNAKHGTEASISALMTQIEDVLRSAYFATSLLSDRPHGVSQPRRVPDARLLLTGGWRRGCAQATAPQCGAWWSEAGRSPSRRAPPRRTYRAANAEPLVWCAATELAARATSGMRWPDNTFVRYYIVCLKSLAQLSLDCQLAVRLQSISPLCGEPRRRHALGAVCDQCCDPGGVRHPDPVLVLHGVRPDLHPSLQRSQRPPHCQREQRHRCEENGDAQEHDAGRGQGTCAVWHCACQDRGRGWEGQRRRRRHLPP